MIIYTYSYCRFLFLLFLPLFLNLECNTLKSCKREKTKYSAEEIKEIEKIEKTKMSCDRDIPRILVAPLLVKNITSSSSLLLALLVSNIFFNQNPCKKGEYYETEDEIEFKKCKVGDAYLDGKFYKKGKYTIFKDFNITSQIYESFINGKVRINGEKISVRDLLYFIKSKGGFLSFKLSSKIHYLYSIFEEENNIISFKIMKNHVEIFSNENIFSSGISSGTIILNFNPGDNVFKLSVSGIYFFNTTQSCGKFNIKTLKEIETDYISLISASSCGFHSGKIEVDGEKIILEEDKIIIGKEEFLCEDILYKYGLESFL